MDPYLAFNVKLCYDIHLVIDVVVNRKWFYNVENDDEED